MGFREIRERIIPREEVNRDIPSEEELSQQRGENSEGDFDEHDDSDSNAAESVRTKEAMGEHKKKQQKRTMIVGGALVVAFLFFYMMFGGKDTGDKNDGSNSGVVSEREQDYIKKLEAQLEAQQERLSADMIERNALVSAMARLTMRVEALQTQVSHDESGAGVGEIPADVVRKSDMDKAIDGILSRFDENARETQEKVDAAQQAAENAARQAERIQEAPKFGDRSKPITDESYERVTKNDEMRKTAAELRRQQLDAPPVFDATPGLSRGTLIAGVLERKLTATTIEHKALVAARLEAPYEIYPGVWLPTGTRFVGKVQPDWKIRKVLVEIDMLTYKNVEIPMEGELLDGDGGEGLLSKYLDPISAHLFEIFALEIGAGIANGLQTTTSQQSIIVISGVPMQTNTQTAERTLRNGVLQGVASGFETYADAFMARLLAEAPTLTVSKGIPVTIQISKKIPLSVLSEAGVLIFEKRKECILR